jgi:nitrate reductase delta subunit
MPTPPTPPTPPTTPTLAQLAAALNYPAQESARAALQSLDGFSKVDPTDLEELYTRTFDINPVCSLEIGWHLFGEDYNRGAFLVRMRGLMREYGIEEGAELPDHLESVLRLLPAMDPTDPDDASDLVREFILPAVQKMRAPFEGVDNPYGTVLAEVERTLRAMYGEPLEWSAPTENTPYGTSSGCGGCHGIC